ncbi:hypothetical protein ACIQXG_03815, partial [Lysinibacillus sphaericus]|uniref:hypothetical protein n=1 Tax=Lysinibacillus sphaericus TaxID=1421 RepID=UPI00380A5DCB
GTIAEATNVAVAAVATNFLYFFGWLAIEKFPHVRRGHSERKRGLRLTVTPAESTAIADNNDIGKSTNCLAKVKFRLTIALFCCVLRFLENAII